MSEKRNYGVDGLRIFSMYLIVILHVLGRGGVLENTVYGTMQHAGAWFLEIASYCAVNCYALISGFVGVKTKFRYSGIMNLWLQVVFYGVTIPLILGRVMPGIVPSFAWKQGIIPISNHNYWYYTAYFAMSFFIPLLNAALNAVSKRELERALALAFAVFSVYPTILQADRFWLNEGYTTWWLVLLYLAGGYFRLYGKEYRGYRFCARYGLGVYLLAGILIWLVYLLIGDRHIPFVFAGNLKADLLIDYTSPLVVIQACALLAWFEAWEPSPGCRKVISWAAPLTFGVYLIHCNPNVFNYVLSDAFVFIASMSPAAIGFVVLFAALAIFMVCALIDWIRLKLFAAARVKLMCQTFFEVIGNSLREIRREK